MKKVFIFLFVFICACSETDVVDTPNTVRAEAGKEEISIPENAVIYDYMHFIEQLPCEAFWQRQSPESDARIKDLERGRPLARRELGQPVHIKVTFNRHSLPRTDTSRAVQWVDQPQHAFDILIKDGTDMVAIQRFFEPGQDSTRLSRQLFSFSDFVMRPVFFPICRYNAIQFKKIPPLIIDAEARAKMSKGVRIHWGPVYVSLHERPDLFISALVRFLELDFSMYRPVFKITELSESRYKAMRQAIEEHIQNHGVFDNYIGRF